MIYFQQDSEKKGIILKTQRRITVQRIHTCEYNVRMQGVRQRMMSQI